MEAGLRGYSSSGSSKQVAGQGYGSGSEGFSPERQRRPSIALRRVPN